MTRRVKRCLTAASFGYAHDPDSDRFVADVICDAGRAPMIHGSTVYVGGIFDQAGNVWSENIGAFTLKLEKIFGDGSE